MRKFFVAYGNFYDSIYTTDVVLYEGEKANENTFKFKLIDIPDIPFPYDIISWSLIED